MRIAWDTGARLFAACLLGAALSARADDLAAAEDAVASERRVGEAGLRLAAFLDSLEVEKHWLAGRHVRWRTGEPDGRPVPPTGWHSHCSAFVAAAATRLGVPILEPPEHPQVLLASAQCRWLGAKGPELGWTRVESALEAQRRANGGDFVVACTLGADRDEPGHIAIVRPASLRASRIEERGPQVTQAGLRNWRSTSLRRGFEHHPGAVARRRIRYFAHSLASLPDPAAESPPRTP